MHDSTTRKAPTLSIAVNFNAEVLTYQFQRYTVHTQLATGKALALSVTVDFDAMC